MRVHAIRCRPDLIRCVLFHKLHNLREDFIFLWFSAPKKLLLKSINSEEKQNVFFLPRVVQQTKWISNTSQQPLMTWHCINSQGEKARAF